MLVKLYGLVWAVFLLLIAVIIAVDYSNPMNYIVFGFGGFTLVFFGMIGVLPVTEPHRAKRK